MISLKQLAIAGIIGCFAWSCSTPDKLREHFLDPPNEYRPMPFLHLNGHLTKPEIEKQLIEAHKYSGFGGIAPLPVSPGPHWHDHHLCPGMTPDFLSNEYFDIYRHMLEVSAKQGTHIVLYDDIDFPSGSAAGRLLKEYPQYTRKYLQKQEFIAAGGHTVAKAYELKPTQSWMALSAMDTITRQVISLQPFLKGNQLNWNAPAGTWRIMAFLIEYNVGPPHGHLVDYMEPAAIEKLMEMTYDEYGKRFGNYLGNVINKTFFDDVGFVFMDQTWNKEISNIFQKKTGKDPALYYPALYYDIGPETRAARVAFYDARSELMAEGYVKQVSEWAEKYHVKSMGHPPENYSPNSVVTCGDILKFYRHADIPLLDVIFHYGRGRNGYKQVSSAADLDDKGLVGAELCGAFAQDMDSVQLYRVAMETMVRGVNFIVPHGLWYDDDTAHIRIPPLISYKSTYIGKAVPDYSAFTARSCVLLQNGKRVVDIAVYWPINAVQGESWIGRDNQSGLAVAQWIPPGVLNYQLSGVLTDSVRRDFTYIRPEDLTNGKVTARGTELVLNNKVNEQHFKVLIIPGGDVISAASLHAIKEYYQHGGKVIAVGALPRHAAEFGRDEEVKKIIADIFNGFPSESLFVKNQQGGQFAYLPTVDKQSMAAALTTMNITPDVAFDERSLPSLGAGCINYTHKQKDGRDIYYFINTTDNPMASMVTLRGKVKDLEIWDPHRGTTQKATAAKQETLADGTPVTVLPLKLDATASLFLVGTK